MLKFLQDLVESSFAKLWVSLGALLASIVGLSTFYVVGYTSEIPRSAFLIFGSSISATVGLEVAFSVVTSLVATRILMIFFAAFFASIGDFQGLFLQPKSLSSGNAADQAAVFIVSTRPIVFFTLAFIVFCFRFLDLSLENLLTIVGWLSLFSILFRVVDRVLLCEMSGSSFGKSAATETSYQSVRALLAASLLSSFSYTVGHTVAKDTMGQTPEFQHIQLSAPGIVFGANDVSLLLFVPARTVSDDGSNRREVNYPSRWVILPFDGQPIDLQ